MIQLDRINRVNGRYKGKTIFIVGTSDSLQDVDLSKIKGFPSIGINYILKNMEELGTSFVPPYLLIVDRGVLRLEMDHVKKYKPKLLLNKDIVNVASDADFEGEIYQFQPITRNYMYIRDALQRSKNTAHYAIEIAYRMLSCNGPGTIALLGIDMFYPKKKIDGKKRKSHFFPVEKRHGCKPAFQWVLQQLPVTKAFLDKRKIRLVTCSPWKGPLTKIIPQVSLDKVVKGV